MVSHVEKLGSEQNALGFGDAKGLANRQVHVRLMWSNKAIARDVAKARRAIRPNYRRQHEGGGAHEVIRSEEHTSELQSHLNLVCRLLLEKKKKNNAAIIPSTHCNYIHHIIVHS